MSPYIPDSASAPRPVLPGQLLFITRRCTQRQFLLRPPAPQTQVGVHVEQSERVIEWQRKWKSMWDPSGLLNPGKKIPPATRTCSE